MIDFELQRGFFFFFSGLVGSGGDYTRDFGACVWNVRAGVRIFTARGFAAFVRKTDISQAARKAPGSVPWELWKVS